MIVKVPKMMLLLSLVVVMKMRITKMLIKMTVMMIRTKMMTRSRKRKRNLILDGGNISEVSVI